MVRLLTLLLILLTPVGVSAATVRADRSIEVSETPADNAYFAGGDVRISAALPEDLLAVAGTLRVLGPVGGDALVAGGTVDLSAPITGDLRAAGGRVAISGDVAGELAVAGGAVSISGKAGEIRAAGGVIEITGGATGPVSVYGGTVALAGEFSGDVFVVASERVTLAEGTIIHGVFEYNAPEVATIPESAQIDGGAAYTGSESFLPTAEEAKTVALAGLGIFFVVRLIAAVLAAGLLAGLFPLFATKLVEESLFTSSRNFMRFFIFGFAGMVLIPILIILLFASFVGIGIAFVLGAAYLLFILLAYLYAALLAGSVLARTLFKRREVLWRDAVLGMLVLYLIGIIPGLGFLVSFVLSAVAFGAMLSFAYDFAFKRTDSLA